MTKRRRNHRGYAVQYKRQVAEEYLVDGVPLREAARRHDVERNLIRIWVEKYQAGEFSEETANAEIVREYEARIASAERKVGLFTMENELLKKIGRCGPASDLREVLHRHRPRGVSVSRGRRVMGVSRSSFYYRPNWAFMLSGLWHACLIMAYRAMSGMVGFPARLGAVLGWAITLPSSCSAGYRSARNPSATPLPCLPGRNAGLLLSPRQGEDDARPAAPRARSRQLIGGGRRALFCPVGLPGAPLCAAAFGVETIAFSLVVALVFIFLRPINQFIYFQF